MSRVQSQIIIDAPLQDVWEAVMDPHRLAKWVTIHRDLEHADEGPPKKGARMEQKLCLRGANFHVKWRLETCRAPTHAVWEGRGPARSKARTEYRLSERDGATCFDYANEFKAPLGPVGAAASRALVGGVPEREAEKSLRKLKALLERG